MLRTQQKGPALRHGQRGQTILLVAISIVALLAMAALAIDVVSLYLAKSEIQRAADAVALAGAKAVADSGITTMQPSDTTDLPTAENMALSMANAAMSAMNIAAAQNLVSGQVPTMSSSTVDFTTHGINNPTVTVTLQQILPTFFARIWSRTSVMTQATATAEVYNPANTQSFNPVTPGCVKPWLIANVDPVQTATLCHFVNTSTGVVDCLPPMGETFFLTADCEQGVGRAGKCVLLNNPPQSQQIGGNPYLQYVPAPTSTNTPSCPSSCVGASSYERTIECCDANAYAYYQCGSDNSGDQILWNPNVDPYRRNESTATATECLIHETGGTGQDSLNYPSGWPNNGPPEITAGSPPLNGQLVTTSSSIVTIPIFDTQGATLNAGGSQVTIVGFLQAFINSVGSPNNANDLSVTVLNVIGCSNTPNGNTPISGGNGSPGAGTGSNYTIPVRLITPPGP